MYSLILSIERQPYLQAVDLAHQYVLERLATAIQRRLPAVHAAGTSDLAVLDRKFSGNSMRVKRHSLLYHGTLLYDFPLDLVDRYLKAPPRQPQYRAGRSHDQFVANLPLDRQTVVAAVNEAFNAEGLLVEWPRGLMQRLAWEKYSRDDWTRRF
jgi:lipoate-protein ligase A